MKKDYLVIVSNTNIHFLCREDEFVLEAMKRSGQGPINYGCFGGGCGICKMNVESGTYAIVKKMSRVHITRQEQDNGVILICCIKPRSNLIIARVK